MAQNSQARNDVPPTAENLPSIAAHGSIVARLLLLAFVIGVVVVECGIAWYVLPAVSHASTTTDGVAQSEDRQLGSEREKEGKGGEWNQFADQMEVDLGEYAVTASYPTLNTTLQVTFHLYGGISSSDQGEFVERRKENEHRFREQVLLAVRSAQVGDLTDAGLGLLKRSILEKTNKVLGRPILQAVIFSDFVLIEQ